MEQPQASTERPTDHHMVSVVRQAGHPRRPWRWYCVCGEKGSRRNSLVKAEQSALRHIKQEGA